MDDNTSSAHATHHQLMRLRFDIQLDKLEQYAQALRDFAPVYEEILRDACAEVYMNPIAVNLSELNLRNDDAMRYAIHDLAQDPRFAGIEDLHYTNISLQKFEKVPPLWWDKEVGKKFNDVAVKYGFDEVGLKQGLLTISQFMVTVEGRTKNQCADMSYYLYLAIEPLYLPRAFQDINEKVAQEFTAKRKLESVWKNTNSDNSNNSTTNYLLRHPPEEVAKLKEWESKNNTLLDTADSVAISQNIQAIAETANPTIVSEGLNTSSKAKDMQGEGEFLIPNYTDTEYNQFAEATYQTYKTQTVAENSDSGATQKLFDKYDEVMKSENVRIPGTPEYDQAMVLMKAMNLYANGSTEHSQ